MSPVEGGAHLEWILGPLRNHGSDGAAFETELAELVVLWLEDLAVELKAEPASSPAADAARLERQTAAAGLQAATREFAAAFLDSTRPERAP